MSHFHDEFFEAQVNAASADDDNLCAYLRQQAADEQQEMEYEAICKEDEAAHSWLDAELDLMKIKSPQDAEAMFNAAIEAQDRALAKLKEIGVQLDALGQGFTERLQELKDFKDSLSSEELAELRSYFGNSKTKAA